MTRAVVLLGGVALAVLALDASAAAPREAPLPVPRNAVSVATESEKNGARTGPTQTPLSPDDVRELLLETLQQAAEEGLVDLIDPVANEAAPTSPDPDDVPALATDAVTTPPGPGIPDPEYANPSMKQDARVVTEDPYGVPDDSDGVASAPLMEPVPAGGWPSSRNDVRDGTADQANENNSPERIVDAASAAVTNAADPEPIACLDPEMLALPHLDDEGGLIEMASALRAKLIGEFDRAAPDVVDGLARTYIAAGVAAEARALLASYGETVESRWTLETMALLLDRRPVPASTPLVIADCVGEQALWRGLWHARHGDDAVAVDAEIGAGRALARLPFIPRQMMAAEIGLAAGRMGEWPTARRLAIIAEQAAEASAHMMTETRRLLAAIARWHDDPAAAALHLVAAVDAGGIGAGYALLDMADLALRSNPPWTNDLPGMMADLEAVAMTKRGTDLGEEAFDRLARLVAGSASREAVVRVLEEGLSAGMVPQDRYIALMTALTVQDNLPGTRPLALVYLDAPERFDPALKRTGFRRAVMQSLIDEGLAGLARDLAQPEDFADAPLAESMALGFLSYGDARAALDVGAQMPEGAERAQVLGLALAATGQTAQALPHLRTATEAPDRPAKARLAAAQALSAAAMSEGDASEALAGAEQAYALAPSEALAEQRALLSLETAPENGAAREAALADPSLQPDLALLFDGRRAPVPGPDAGPGALDRYLEGIQAEAEVIAELLNDG